MGRPGITKQEVLDTIEGLAAEGVKATATNVRERLQKGSFSTISAVLSEWRSERENGNKPDVPEMPGTLEHLARSIWREAWKLAFATHETERANFRRERDDFEIVKAEMSAEIQRLEQELEAEAEKTALVTRERDTVRSELSDVRYRLTHAEARANSAEEQSRKLDLKIGELCNRLGAEIARKEFPAERIEHFDKAKGRRR